MKVITIIGTAFSGSSRIAAKIASKTGYKVLSDQEIMDETVRKYNIPKSRLEKSLYYKSSLYGEGPAPLKRQAVAALKVVLSEMILRDNCVYAGYLGHLIPENISLRVLMVADLSERLQILWGQCTKEAVKEKEALLRIRKQDKKLKVWRKYLWERDLCDNTPYDLIVQSSNAAGSRTLDKIIENLSAKTESAGDLVEAAADDFYLASRIALAAAQEGHDVTVSADKGAVTISINKYCLMLNTLKKKLRSIAARVSGVKSVEVGVGKKFYRSDICCGHDFLLPPDDLGAGRQKRNSLFLIHALGPGSKGT